MAERVRAFLKLKAVQTAGSAKIHWKKHYIANVEALKALDHALQAGPGLSLRHFVARRRLRALGVEQKRYYIDGSLLPPHLAADGGHRTRSCIQDQTGKRFLEVAWSQDRMVLFESLDCGSIGWPGRFWLYSAGGVRGGFFADPCHVRYNRFQTAAREGEL